MEYPTRNDLDGSVRSSLIAMLNQSLANTLDLKTQAKQAHWNVKGLNFYQLHELFDQVATQLDEYVDTIAERITALGGVALGTVRLTAQASAITEFPTDITDGKAYVTALADRLAMYGKSVRADIDKAAQLGDAGTSDLYTGISREVDKLLWFLEAHLH
jgi:starvation-inducible DNA-binding protein